jgi:hypothetical protein
LAQEHCGPLAVSSAPQLAPKTEERIIMSEPRFTDSRRTDPFRRLDVQGSNRAGTIWTWLAAIIAVVVVLGLIIGYSRTDQASIQSSEPTTTGAAPSSLRFAPKSGDVQQPEPAAPAPVTPASDPNQ